MNHDNKTNKPSNNISRRDIIKGLASIPVLGAFAVAFFSKRHYDQSNENKIFADLGIDKNAPGILKNSPNQKTGQLVRLGIIGVGSRGTPILESLGFFDKSTEEIDEIQNDLNIAITGVCDVYDVHAEKGIALSRNNRFSKNKDQMPGAKRFRHYQELINNDEIDAVIIATPDHWHARMVTDAANAGKHIYCEKCLTRTIEEARQIRNVIKKSDIVFQYGHQNRQQYSYFLAREIIKKNVLGKITVIKTHTNRNTPRGAWIRHIGENIDPRHVDWKQWLGDTPYEPFTPNRYFGWQKWFEYSGGLPAHMFSHEYDAINQVLEIGIPQSAMASGGIYYWKDERNTPDVMQVVFKYPDRELVLVYDATLASSSTGEYESGAKVKEIMGSDAWMKLSMNIHVIADRHSKQFKEKIDSGVISPSRPFLSYIPGTKENNLDAVTSASEKYYASQGLVYTYKEGKKINVTYLHFKEWLDCIRNGGQTSCNIDRAFEDAITCLMATKSYREDRKVEWDANKEMVI